MFMCACSPSSHVRHAQRRARTTASGLPLPPLSRSKFACGSGDVKDHSGPVSKLLALVPPRRANLSAARSRGCFSLVEWARAVQLAHTNRERFRYGLYEDHSISQADACAFGVLGYDMVARLEEARSAMPLLARHLAGLATPSAASRRSNAHGVPKNVATTTTP
eukprot:7351009-Prymnesium_polylepis.3